MKINKSFRLVGGNGIFQSPCSTARSNERKTESFGHIRLHIRLSGKSHKVRVEVKHKEEVFLNIEIDLFSETDSDTVVIHHIIHSLAEFIIRMI